MWYELLEINVYRLSLNCDGINITFYKRRFEIYGNRMLFYLFKANKWKINK